MVGQNGPNAPQLQSKLHLDYMQLLDSLDSVVDLLGLCSEHFALNLAYKLSGKTCTIIQRGHKINLPAYEQNLSSVGRRIVSTLTVTQMSQS